MIKEVDIQNFKSLAKNNFELENLTLLTGASSSGKSTLIQAILFLKGNFEEKSDVLNVFKNSMKLTDKEILEAFLRNVSLENRYISIGNASDVLYEKAEEDKIKIGLKLQTGDVLFNCKVEDRSSKILNNSLKCTGDISELLKEQNLSYISANRIVPESSYKYSKENIEKGQLGKNGEYAIHYLAENKNKKIEIEALKHEDSSGLDLGQNTAKWLSEISKGINIDSVVNYNSEVITLRYTYESKYGVKTLLPQNVGFGITYILPVIIAILKSKPGDIVIIENPEAHLHPTGIVKISKLFSLAAANGVQVILETHSDHILNGIRVAIKEKVIDCLDVKTYYFSKNLGDSLSEVEKIEINENGKIEKWPIGFFDEWENQLEKLLW
ncbi:MAG: AAA family ATPase [Cetobacterium sp.]|uniref:AAA family ATPase n=1 Tax=Cetobacterium sp. TaxID=2071632 RepID=UPI003EE7F4C0